MASKAKLRDLFACEAFSTARDILRDGNKDGWLGVARLAYTIADAMMVARSVPSEAAEGTPASSRPDGMNAVSAARGESQEADK